MGHYLGHLKELVVLHHPKTSVHGSVSFKKWSFWGNKLSESGNAAVQIKRA